MVPATDVGYLAAPFFVQRNAIPPPSPTYRSQGWHPTQIPKEWLRQHVLDVEIPRKSSKGPCQVPVGSKLQIWSVFVQEL